MVIKDEVATILAKKMDRGEFIKHVGIGLVALTGLSTALKVLAPTKSSISGFGYGGSAYGGVKKDV